jgi:hypothetical protein
MRNARRARERDRASDGKGNLCSSDVPLLNTVSRRDAGGESGATSARTRAL